MCVVNHGVFLLGVCEGSGPDTVSVPSLGVFVIIIRVILLHPGLRSLKGGVEQTSPVPQGNPGLLSPTHPLLFAARVTSPSARRASNLCLGLWHAPHVHPGVQPPRPPPPPLGVPPAGGRSHGSPDPVTDGFRPHEAVTRLKPPSNWTPVWLTPHAPARRPWMGPCWPPVTPFRLSPSGHSTAVS